MKKELSFEEALHKSVDYFLNELESVNWQGTDSLPQKHLFLVYKSEIPEPNVGKTLFEAMIPGGIVPESIPENIYAFEFETNGKQIIIGFPLRMEKVKKDSFSYESAKDIALHFFINEVLDHREKFDVEPLIEKHAFIVVIPRIKTPFVGETLSEALELSGYSSDNIPEQLFAYEFQSEGNYIRFNYAFPEDPYANSWATSGEVYCPIWQRGFIKFLRNKKD